MQLDSTPIECNVLSSQTKAEFQICIIKLYLFYDSVGEVMLRYRASLAARLHPT